MEGIRRLAIAPELSKQDVFRCLAQPSHPTRSNVAGCFDAIERSSPNDCGHKNSGKYYSKLHYYPADPLCCTIDIFLRRSETK